MSGCCFRILSISSSLVTLARMEAAATLRYRASALCSQLISRLSLWLMKPSRIFCQLSVFIDGQSTITFILSFLSFNSLMMSAMCLASSLLRLLPGVLRASSICFGSAFTI